MYENTNDEKKDVQTQQKRERSSKERARMTHRRLREKKGKSEDCVGVSAHIKKRKQLYRYSYLRATMFCRAGKHPDEKKKTHWLSSMVSQTVLP